MYVLKSALDVGAHLNWIYDRSYIDKVQCRTNSQIDNSYRARLVQDTVSEDNFKVLRGAAKEVTTLVVLAPQKTVKLLFFFSTTKMRTMIVLVRKYM